MVHSDFGAQNNKICHCLHLMPSYLPWSDGIRYHDISFFFLILHFKPAFSLSSFTLIKRLFSCSSFSAIRSAYLRLLIFLPEILILAWNSSGLASQMTYCVYKLNQQGDNILSWLTPFSILNQSIVPWIWIFRMMMLLTLICSSLRVTFENTIIKQKYPREEQLEVTRFAECQIWGWLAIWWVK